MMPKEIDTTNRHLVAARGASVVIMAPPIGPMTRTEALTLAAWLVAIADGEPGATTFDEILRAVQST